MAGELPSYERGHTVQFTWVGSVAPAAAPRFAVFDPTSALVASFAATSSDTTHYYAFFTIVASYPNYLYEWIATATVAGSTRDFINRGEFKVLQSVAY